MRLYVPLNRQEYEALERMAFAERRRPQDQAATMLAQALAREPVGSPSNRDRQTDLSAKEVGTPEGDRVPA